MILLGAFSPSEAHAFCRTVTQATPAGYDPAVSGCYPGNGGAAYDVYWKNQCVTYSLQQDASQQILLADAKNVAAKAFAAWSNVTCSGGGPPAITASEVEPPAAQGVSCNEVQYNSYGPNQNLIVFRDQGWPNQGDTVNTLGFTTVTFDATTGEIYDADMEINSHDFQLVAFPPAPANGYDLESIMTHEAGHFLGLAHSSDTSAVMYAFYHLGATALQADDVTGICSIYPPSDVRATSSGPVAADACCPVPRHGLSTTCAPEDANGKVIAAPADASTPPIIAPCSSGAPPAAESPSASHRGGCSVAGNTDLGKNAGGGALALFGLTYLARRRKLQRA